MRWCEWLASTDGWDSAGGRVLGVLEGTCDLEKRITENYTYCIYYMLLNCGMEKTLESPHGQQGDQTINP